MSPTDDYDIVIVGAGPAGATAATYAAKSDFSVLLIDKKKDIGVPLQCGGFLTHERNPERVSSRCRTSTPAS